MVSLKPAPVPARAVHIVNGETERSQLYVGPGDAGVPVVAGAVLLIVTVLPGQTPDPVIVPGLCVVDQIAMSALRDGEVHCGTEVY